MESGEFMDWEQAKQLVVRIAPMRPHMHASRSLP